MEPRKLTELLTAAMMLANATPERWIAPRPWQAANDAKRPTSGKDRSKVKSARKQRNCK
jgi:hypothetical protein